MYEARPTGLEPLASLIKMLAEEAWQPETNPWNLPKAGMRKMTTEALSDLHTPRGYGIPLSSLLLPSPQNNSNKI